MTDVSKTAFGAALKRRRNAAGLTLAALAPLLPADEGRPISPQVLSNWENGLNFPRDRRIIVQLEEVLGVADHELSRLAGLVSDDSLQARVDEIDRRLGALAAEVAAMRLDVRSLIGGPLDEEHAVEIARRSLGDDLTEQDERRIRRAVRRSNSRIEALNQQAIAGLRRMVSGEDPEDEDLDEAIALEVAREYTAGQDQESEMPRAAATGRLSKSEPRRRRRPQPPAEDDR